VATNLRLRSDAEEALRTKAAQSGVSQQDLIRAAVDEYLHLTPPPVPRTDSDGLVSTGAVLPARTSYRRADARIRLPAGVSSLDLLDRDERLSES
jgi:hypothetical protein